MKKHFINEARIEGYVYQHTLQEKTVQNTASANFGKPFINGSVFVATDEEGLNVVEVHYSYVPPVTAKEKANPNYKALKRIMEGPTWIENGKDEAIKVILQPSVVINDFYDLEGTLVSAKRLEGGFVTICEGLIELNPKLEDRNKFIVDMVITSVKLVEADEEKGYPEYAEVRGCIFDFKGALFPLDIRMRNSDGINWLLNLDISPQNPYFLKLWGKVVSETVTIETTEESPFGEPLVRTVQRSHKEWVMTGCNPDTEPFGEDSTINKEELDAKVQERNVYLATVKKRSDEYRAQKNSGNKTAATAPTSSPDGFNF